MYIKALQTRRQYGRWRWESFYRRECMPQQALVGYDEVPECIELLKARTRTDFAEMIVGLGNIVFRIDAHPYIEFDQMSSNYDENTDQVSVVKFALISPLIGAVGQLVDVEIEYPHCKLFQRREVGEK